jgi:hypothetical protein
LPQPTMSWVANDGKLFPNEADATKHEVFADLRKSFPDLKSSISTIEARLPDLCRILAPMVDLYRRDHPAQPHTTRQPAPGVYRAEQGPGQTRITGHLPLPCDARQFSDQMICETCDLTWDTNDSNPPSCKRPADHGELAGTCDCAALMAGNGPPHAPSCPSYRPPADETDGDCS